MAKDKFTVLHFNGIDYIDHTDNTASFIRDSFALDFEATDYLYIGLYKPFSTLYFELKGLSVIDTALNFEYWNGTAWIGLVNQLDDTKAFTRSGFITFDLDQDKWASKSVDAETNYWIRIHPDLDLTPALEIQGIGVLFSSDLDLKEEVFEIEEYLQSGQLSFVNIHQTVKKDILQMINNRGRTKRKNPADAVGLDRITEFDVLSPTELNQTAKYMALEKIYFNISDSLDDKYYQKSQDYRKLAFESFDLYYLTLDIDDDGKIRASEKNKIERVEIIRL